MTRDLSPDEQEELVLKEKIIKRLKEEVNADTEALKEKKSRLKLHQKQAQQMRGEKPERKAREVKAKPEPQLVKEKEAAA
jgi:hypothetical protein